MSCTFFTQSAYAQKGLILRNLGKAGMLFLGGEVAKNLIKTGIDSIVPPPTQKAPNPITINNYHQTTIFQPLPSAPKPTYVGSFFQCEMGCKYYWSQSTGWQILSSEDGSWHKIREPYRNVIRTHNIYYVNGEFISKPIHNSYGYVPGYGWAYF
jgi:hypothetical protein